MIQWMPLIGCLTTGAALALLISLYLKIKDNVKVSLGRIFLKRNESTKAMEVLTYGILFFAIGRFVAVLYEIELVPRPIYLVFQSLMGTAYTICLIYSLYKLISIVKRRSSEL